MIWRMGLKLLSGEHQRLSVEQNLLSVEQATFYAEPTSFPNEHHGFSAEHAHTPELKIPNPCQPTSTERR